MIMVVVGIIVLISAGAFATPGIRQASADDTHEIKITLSTQNGNGVLTFAGDSDETERYVAPKTQVKLTAMPDAYCSVGSVFAQTAGSEPVTLTVGDDGSYELEVTTDTAVIAVFDKADDNGVEAPTLVKQPLSSRGAQEDYVDYIRNHADSRFGSGDAKIADILMTSQVFIDENSPHKTIFDAWGAWGSGWAQ